MTRWITTPDDPALDELCNALEGHAAKWDAGGAWPAESLALCGEFGVHSWFFPKEWGGQEWSEADLLRGYLKLSQACLTTTFILTQRNGACSRIVGSANREQAERLVPDLLSGESFATVGISHLTTSRRHLSKPVLAATPTDGGFRLDGYSPWVTGAAHARTVVVGATLPDGRQILAAVDTRRPGVAPGPPLPLVGLSASHTGELRFAGARIPAGEVLAGPEPNVMSAGTGARTGGLQTSCLAIGLAGAAIGLVAREKVARAELGSAEEGLERERAALEADLLASAAGCPPRTADDLRARANSLALRSAQAALAAAKGSGYVVGHPAGRLCREALFFLVWSCPQPVVAANLCELAGLSE